MGKSKTIDRSDSRNLCSFYFAAVRISDDEVSSEDISFLLTKPLPHHKCNFDYKCNGVQIHNTKIDDHLAH